MGRSREITGLVALIGTLLAMGVAAARDATWKDCELAARDPDRSIAACSKILKRPSSQAHAAAFHHRGQAYAAKGNLDQAISDISAGIRLDPHRAYRWQERGELYTRQGKYQLAIADITEVIRRDPTRSFRFQSRAEAYQSLGDLTRAIADYDEAIRLDPMDRSFRFRARANALRDAGQYNRALADYETTLKLAPTDAWALVDRGRTYARMGRSEAAKNDFDSALKLDPANEQLRHAIEVGGGGANAATDDEKKRCVQYDTQPVTLTGTVLVRKIDYEEGNDEPPEGSVKFPLLVLDQPICTWGTDEESAFLQWALQIADKCGRTWPDVSRVKVTGTLYRAFNWHHHSEVLVSAEQIDRLDGQLPACAAD